MKRRYTAYLAACLLAAGTPFVSRSGVLPAPSVHHTHSFPGWPGKFQGKPLTPVPLFPREKDFYRNFDGEIARFTDGERQIIIRWVAGSTRQFHLTTRCFRTNGYTLSPLTAHKDAYGDMWGVFRAERNSDILEVRERIFDNEGRSWTDESSWRWDAFWNRTSGPWWAYTVAHNALD